MFEKYSQIMYNGGYDQPITVTFPAHHYQMVITGEGGNRHLILRNSGGSVDLWVDTHCGQGTAFIHSIRIDDEPGARFLLYIINRLRDHAYKIDDVFHYFKISALDKMFAEIYEDMKNNYISR